MPLTTATLDLVDELRLRRWARENYVPHAERSTEWHAVIHDEMLRRDAELQVAPECHRARIVPLLTADLFEDGPEPLRGPVHVAPTKTDATALHFG